MLRSDDRILTSHTGSLPRPPDLTDLYIRRAKGERIDPEAIELAGKTALSAAIRNQKRVGLDIANDGEQRREGFFIYAVRRMSGFGGGWVRPQTADLTRYPDFGRAVAREWREREAINNRGQVLQAVDEIRYLDRRAIETECAEFHLALDEESAAFAETFMNAPSPGIFAAVMQNVHYENEDAYLAALGAAMQVEYEAIVGQGFLLQVDAPELAMERHVSYSPRSLSDFLGFAERCVAALNDALCNIPRERVRMHVCWGNYEGPHDCDVPLKEILPVIRQAKVGGLVLPFANPRHAHEYRCLERGALAEDQILVAGVVDPLTNFIEHPEVVAQRIEQLARAIGDPRRIIAGTDCGFDTAAGGSRVASDVAWEKLQALHDGAKLATASLF